MRQRFPLLLVLAIATAHSLRAQQPSFRIFTTQDGLVRNWVTKIHRDSKGYLWFCTVEGISLFDGYRFTNFSTRDGLPSRLVSDMTETGRGDYWFATDAGLARFHRNHGNAPAFEVIRVGDSKESNDVQALYEGHDGTIWCGTAAGLYRFRPQDGEPGPHLTPLDGKGPLEVEALVEDSRRNLWVATPRALLRRRPNGEVDSLPSPVVRLNTMLVDRHDRLWAGGFGLAGVDTKTEPPRVLPPEEIPDKTRDLITALYEGEHGEIWIGKSTGLVRFRPDASPPQVLAYASAGSPAREHSRIAQRGQLEILGMLAQGHSYKTCADSLHVGLDTVRSHVRKIYERLHVHSRSEAVWKVLQEGLLRRGRGSYS